MTVLGNDLAKTFLDNDSDNAGQARSQLEAIVDAVNGILGAIGDDADATVTGAGQTLNLGTTDAGVVQVANGGSGVITSFGTPANRTEYKILRLASGLTIDHNSTIQCPDSVDIVASANDIVLVFWDDSQSRWEVLGHWPTRIQIATTDQVQAGTTGDKAVTADALWSAITAHALTDAASIAIDMHQGPNFEINPIGGNRTLAAPSNQRVEQTGRIFVKQDGTGNRTLSYNSVYTGPQGVVPTLSTQANAIDCLYYDVIASSGSDSIVLTSLLNVTGLS